MQRVMTDKLFHLKNVKGLSSMQVKELQKEYGKNILQKTSSRRFIHIVWDILKEPMFILLIIACTLYFVLGEISEGIMMLVAMVIVAAISIYQEVKSNNALKALQQFTEPKIKVIRDGIETIISTEDLVVKDVLMVEEGMKIPADAVVLQANDFTVNESILTGESLPVEKNDAKEYNILYQGTTVNTGKALATVTAIGINTTLGKLGKSIADYTVPKTLLQVQVNTFVRRFALFGLLGFLIIFIANFVQQQQLVTSLLFALTLAMSAVPEEIPVAFSSFMALGTYKMSRLGIITRQPQIIENLGAVSVICVDKTGTITENKMEVKTIYDFDYDLLIELKDDLVLHNGNVLRYATLASEQKPFDAMEKAICEAYTLYAGDMEQLPTNMIYEYPLEGKPPMMTHVYEYAGVKIVATKGAAERVISICNMSDEDSKRITLLVKKLAAEGYRVLGVASAVHTENIYPTIQDDFNWKFEGLVALYDPPKKNIEALMKEFYDAKIEIKLITGDYPETAINIATQVGIKNAIKYATGEQIEHLEDSALQALVKDTNIFARMFPDAKLKVINALKANGEIVAMIGDGVNDGPALKAANIGIAMGERGTEIARQASDLIITDDNLENMVTAISQGRKLFSNIKKAFRYIISIHIPIIFTASLPVIFGWLYPNIFTPIHIIFMELIMGPTCSIFYEREPVEANIMQQKPRQRNAGLFSKDELLISIVQGIIIAVGALFLYYYFMQAGTNIAVTRNIVFTTLILSNVFLTFANRSFTKTMYYTIRYKNNLAPMLLIISILFLVALHFVPFITNLFQLGHITQLQFFICLAVSFVSVMWFEVYKTDLVKFNKK
jgi:P-type Ca2+ transporter type 2C